MSRSIRIATVLTALSLSNGCDSGDQAAKTPAPNPDQNQQPMPEPEAKTPEPKRETGLPCSSDDQCESGMCAEFTYKDIKGAEKTDKACSECKDDSVCQAQNPAHYCVHHWWRNAKVCDDGQLGARCDNDAQCSAEGSSCAKVNLGDNQATVFTCASCKAHGDCTDPAKPLCITRPQNASERQRAHNTCEAEGVRKAGEICFPCDTGNRECTGKCVKVNHPHGDDFCVGVCGSCETDADCDASEICESPKLTLNQNGIHIPSRCVPRDGGDKPEEEKPEEKPEDGNPDTTTGGEGEGDPKDGG